MRIPSSAARFLGPLARDAGRRGTPLYAVGGCVRDWLLGRPTRDLDLAVEGEAAPLAEACARRWGGRAEAFGRFGTARVRLPGGYRLDFARSRAESYPEPAALPVVRPAPIAQDLGRRDFSVNALALALPPGGGGGVLDPFRGREDLAARRLRILHPASFRDDPTRMYRAARYAGRLGLRLEGGTLARLRASAAAGHAGLLSRERLAAELWLLLGEEDPAPAFGLLSRWRLLDAVWPRLRWKSALKASGAGGRGPRLGAEARLAGLALGLGPRGEEFLASLRLDRELHQRLSPALRAAAERASPAEPLTPAAREALAVRFPRLPKAATLSRLLRGEDLRRLGLPPGPDYGRRLASAAKAQWRGEFSDRAGALRWLKAGR